MSFIILYYHKIFIFAVIERWLIYDCETECSFVCLITDKYNARHLCDYDIIDLIANWNLGQDKTKLNSHCISRLHKTAKTQHV